MGVMASLTSEGEAGTLCESVDLDSGMNLTLDAGTYSKLNSSVAMIDC